MINFSDLICNDNSVNDKKLWFNIYNVLIVFGAIWGFLHPNPIIGDLILILGGLAHGQKTLSDLISNKYGSTNHAAT